MKKFKRIFYTIYILLAIAGVFFSIDGLIKTERMLNWINLRFTPSTQVYLVLILVLILGLLMLIELILEMAQMRGLKNQIPELEDEIKSLKARLFDKGETDGKDKSEEEDFDE